MTKSQLSALLAARYGLPFREADKAVSAVVATLSEALAIGRRIELRGFGSFKLKTRQARMGRNPRTGEAVPVDEKRHPHFRSSKEVLERLN